MTNQKSKVSHDGHIYICWLYSQYEVIKSLARQWRQ